MRILLFALLLVMIGAGISEARPLKVRWSRPNGSAQVGYYNSYNVDELVEILPPAGWKPRSSLNRSLVKSGSNLALAGAAGITRKAAATGARAIPYIGLAITGYMAYNDIRDALSDNPNAESEYPVLTDALTHREPGFEDGTTANPLRDVDPGDKVKTYDGHYVTVGGLKRSTTVGFWGVNLPIPPNGTVQRTTDGGVPVIDVFVFDGQALNGGQMTWKFHHEYYYYTDNGTTAPGDLVRDATDAEVMENANGTESGLDKAASDQFKAELDRLAAADRADEIDYSTYNTLASDYQNAANQQAQDDAEAAKTQAENAKNAAQTARDNAYNAYQQNPTPDNYQKYLEAEMALQNALLALQEAIRRLSEREADNSATPAEVAAGEYDGTIDPPDKKDIKTLITNWMSNSPLTAIVRTLSVEGVDPVCSFTEHVDMVDKDISFDFCQWRTYIEGLGAVLLVVCHGLAVFIIFGRKE